MKGIAKVLVPLAIFSCIGVAILAILGKWVPAFVIALIPLTILLICLSFVDRLVAFLLLFIINYFVPVLSHYVPNAPLGLLMDAAILFNMLIILCSYMSANKKDWPQFSALSKDLLFLTGIWLLYCFVEILNPHMTDVKAWLSGLRSMALYFFFIILLVQLSVKDFSQVKTILAVWSALVILSAAKAAFQKYIGFTPGDIYFLDVMDGRRTHIIYYGTRYFSIFSDAANFGGSMGMALVVFLIAGFHTSNVAVKGYWWFVAACACYGMFISGTRSALVIPVAGILLYLLLVRDFKKMVPIGVLLGLVFCFLAYTNIGNSNATIRRARTVFNRTEDLSYQIRKTNQKELRKLMKSMPIGNSLGMSGGRAKRYGDTSALTDIPTDSWFVQLWVETGVIGQLLYFAIMAYIFIKGGIIIFFRLKKPEIKGLCAGMLSGVAGLFVMSSNNEVFTQFPNGIIVYMLLALVFMAPALEKKLDGTAA